MRLVDELVQDLNEHDCHAFGGKWHEGICKATPSLEKHFEEFEKKGFMLHKEHKFIPGYKTIEKRINHKIVLIDIPIHINYAENDIGYQVHHGQGVVRIRIVPKNKYEKKLLSWKELQERFKLIIKEHEDLGPIILLAEDPLMRLDREGRVHWISKEHEKKNFITVKTRYENPHESEYEDYRMEPEE